MTTPEPTGTPAPRPRPQYGEYATPDEALAAARARDPWPAPTAPTASPAPVAPPAAVRAPSSIDRTITIALLVFGGFSTAYAIATMLTLRENFATLYTAYGIDGIHQAGPVDSVAATLVIVSHVALLAGAVLLARTRLKAGRLSFWIPLTAGAIASVIFFVAFAVIIAADPNLVEFLQSTPTLPAPSTAP